MWKYSGQSDPDHASPEDLPDDEVWSRLGWVLQLRPKEMVVGKPISFNASIMSKLVCSLPFRSCFFLCFSYFLISGHPFCRDLKGTSPSRTFLRDQRAGSSRLPRKRWQTPRRRKKPRRFSGRKRRRRRSPDA